MSLPNYIINLPELASIISGALTGGDKITSKVQKSIGFMCDSKAHEKDEIVWIPDEDIGIIGIRFGQEDIRNMGYDDNFDIKVDGEDLLTNVHHKELNEYKDFRTPRLVAKGTEVVIINKNESDINKEIKYDIDYIEATIPQKEIIIICRDIADDSVIGRFTVFYKPIFEGFINPPSIEGYTPVSPPKKVNIRVGTISPKTIEFYYEKLPPPPPPPPEIPSAPPIDHLYDWAFVLRWEGGVTTDLDFHVKYGDSEIYYSNKNDVLRDNDNNIISGVWLDHDFTSHSGANDRESKPEIITVLGDVIGKVKLFVRNYRAGDHLTEDVTVDIYRHQSDGTLRLLETIVKDALLFHPDKQDVDIATINLDTEEITVH